MTWRTVLLVAAGLLVAVGTVAPTIALAQVDVSASAEAMVETEPNDIAEMATPIELDQRVRGNMSRYDTDVFAVDVVRPGARITVDAVKDAVGDVTYLSVSVFAADGYEYVGGGAVDDDQTNGTVLATARGVGTYYVRLGGDADDVSYEFEVTTSNVDGVPQKRNRVNATSLTPGEAAAGTLSADTEAWYTVNATAGDELTANLTADRNYVNDTSIQIHGPNGAFVAGKVGSFESHVVVSTVAQENGTYYVYLTRSSSAPLDYALATTVRGTADSTEPNEDRTNATPIEIGTTIIGNLAAGDQDWYALEAAAGEAILPRLELVGPEPSAKTLGTDEKSPDDDDAS